VGCKVNLLSKFSWLTLRHDANERINSNPPPGMRMIGGLVIQKMASQNSSQPQTSQFLQFRFPTHPTNNKDFA
jgi:hypothetical protein